MAIDTQNMDLAACFIDGVTQGLALNGKPFIFFGELRVPALQGTIETIGIDTDQRLSERCTGRNLTNPVAATAAKAFPCF